MAAQHISFSSLDAYDSCAMSWHAQREELAIWPKSEILTIGIMTHDAAEQIVRYCEERSVEMIPFEIVADLVQQVFVQNKEATNTASFASVMIAAKTFARTYRHRIGSVIELEQWVRVQIDPAVPELLGRLDQVTREEDEQGSFIGNTDLKTGWAMEQTDRNRFQLDLQSLMLKIAYPDERVKSRNWFIRAGAPMEWYEPKEYDYDNARRRLIAICQRLEQSRKTDTWKPTPGEHCTYCPIAVRCEMVQQLRAQSHAVVTLQDAQAAMLEAHVLSAALETRKNALKKFVKTYGPVFVGEVVAEYRTPAPSRTLSDYAAVRDRIGDEVFGLFGAPLKRALKKLEDDPRLSGLWEYSQPKPRFAIGKLKEGEDDE